MIQRGKILACFYGSILVLLYLIVPLGEGCKDIVIASTATEGDYSLLLKVRDPSRDGLQVLCRVPAGTHYTYQHPWTGRPWDFLINHTFIGVATKGDVLPNIVKAGMVLTDAGLAFGDADTQSQWINPTKNAWDDFDWIRFACQTANTEQEAIDLLTSVVVDDLHATGVSENLFLVGPQRAVVIEADAIHHSIHDVDDVCVMSNYANDLWRTQLLRSVPIARSFESQKETWVHRGSIVHLGSLCGVRISSISQNFITAHVFPAFVFKKSGLEKEVNISLGERATVGPYSVTLLEINNTVAQLSICTAVHAWEQAVLTHIIPTIGTISIGDLMEWSRLHSEDLQGLRPLCEDAVEYEAAMAFRIPEEHANLISSGWFAANHPCSSIYVPVHICDDDIYHPYETGEAATLSLALLRKYGHGNITSLCESIENVFLFENELNEALAHLMIHSNLNITPFLTELDTGMQEHAFLTEQLWLSEPNVSRVIIENIWKDNYSTTQKNIQKVMSSLKMIPESDDSILLLEKIANSISDYTETRQVMELVFFIKSSSYHKCT